MSAASLFLPDDKSGDVAAEEEITALETAATSARQCVEKLRFLTPEALQESARKCVLHHAQFASNKTKRVRDFA